MKKIKFDQEQIVRIIEMYTKEFLGLRPIGKEFGVSNFVIKNILKENNIQIGATGRKWIGGKEVANKKYSSKPEVIERKSKNSKEWFQKNKEYRKEYHKQWREKNRETYQEYRRNYEKTKKDSDPHYRLSCYTRTAIYTCLKERNVNKYQNTFDLLPYSLEQLIERLESQFQDNMTWDNYGDWHVDHIKPMNSFQFESIEDEGFKECWGLDNLQPLWAEDNLSKGSIY